MGFFSGRAVLLNDLGHEKRAREYWQNRAESLELKLEQERERARHVERYLLDLLLIKQVKASPVPPLEEPPVPEPRQDDETAALLEQFRNSEFSEWARQAGVSDAEAYVQFERLRPLYEQQFGG